MIVHYFKWSVKQPIRLFSLNLDQYSPKDFHVHWLLDEGYCHAGGPNYGGGQIWHDSTKDNFVKYRLIN